MWPGAAYNPIQSLYKPVCKSRDALTIPTEDTWSDSSSALLRRFSRGSGAMCHCHTRSVVTTLPPPPLTAGSSPIRVRPELARQLGGLSLASSWAQPGGVIPAPSPLACTFQNDQPGGDGMTATEESGSFQAPSGPPTSRCGTARSRGLDVSLEDNPPRDIIELSLARPLGVIHHDSRRVSALACFSVHQAIFSSLLHFRGRSARAALSSHIFRNIAILDCAPADVSTSCSFASV